MEYRRNRRRPRRAGGTSTFPAYVAVCAVFFGIIYLVSASRAGTWVANNWIAPALKSSDNAISSTAEPSVRPTPETVVIDQMTQEAVLPERLFYALQIGVYADEDNANAQALALAKIGAAGHVLVDGERYRVLASAYPDRESAQKVAAQLLNEGIESRVHVLTRAERRLTASGTGKQVESITRAVGQVDEVLDALYQAFISFDKDRLSVADGILSLRGMEQTARSAAQALDTESFSADSALGGVDHFYEIVIERLDALFEMGASSTPAFSSALKEFYITAVLTLI